MSDSGRSGSGVSAAARRLKELRTEAGLSMASVARHLGFAHPSRYQHYEDRFKRAYLPVELAERLAPLFAQNGVAAQEVLALAGVAPRRAEPPGKLDRLPLELRAARKDLPILGAAMGGGSGYFFNDGVPKDFALRPPSLAGVSNGFAVYVYGDSMEPRYLRGEIVHVNPNRPLTSGCFVVVELTDGRGMIKQFVRQDDRRVVLRQFRPEQELIVERSQIARISRVVGSAEP
ncbi:MAG: repressor protein [Rhodospirillales bacterium]|jgi:SOS-response transcriptional repressor LexA|nr:repressor protein [Rhodospirillales bacterium]